MIFAIVSVVMVVLLAVAICYAQPRNDDEEQAEFIRKWYNEHKR